MLSNFWTVVASGEVSIVVGILVVVVLAKCGFHRSMEGKLSRRKLASVFGLSISAYTFSVCAIAQLGMGEPTVSKLVEFGFGNERMGWLLLILVADQAFKLWSEFEKIT